MVRKLALFEYDATASDLVVAPTLIAVEMQAGDDKEFVLLSLPEATIAS
jgi:hypothetical protein